MAQASLYFALGRCPPPPVCFLPFHSASQLFPWALSGHLHVWGLCVAENGPIGAAVNAASKAFSQIHCFAHGRPASFCSHTQPLLPEPPGVSQEEVSETDLGQAGRQGGSESAPCAPPKSHSTWLKTLSTLPAHHAAKPHFPPRIRHQDTFQGSQVHCSPSLNSASCEHSGRPCPSTTLYLTLCHTGWGQCNHV